MRNTTKINTNTNTKTQTRPADFHKPFRYPHIAKDRLKT